MANKGRLTTGIFCLFLAGLLAWHIALPDRVRSETENRTLAQFPDFSLETLKTVALPRGWRTILPTSSLCGMTGRA